MGLFPQFSFKGRLLKIIRFLSVFQISLGHCLRSVPLIASKFYASKRSPFPVFTPSTFTSNFICQARRFSLRRTGVLVSSLDGPSSNFSHGFEDISVIITSQFTHLRLYSV